MQSNINIFEPFNIFFYFRSKRTNYSVYFTGTSTQISQRSSAQ